jgi:hypothetical protein
MESQIADLRPTKCLVMLAVIVHLAARPALATPATPPPAATPAARGMTVADIGACIRRNIVDRGSLRQLNITTTDREGRSRALKMKLFWKPENETGEQRMTLQVTAPPEVAGSAYLVISKPAGDEVFVYLPAFDRVQRLAGSDGNRPLWGTDFTYAEIKQIQGLFREGDTRRVDDATVFDRPAFVLETDTDPERTGYDLVKSYIDQKTCTLLKSELLGKNGKPLKLLEADLETLLQVDPWWLILGYVMYDNSKGTHTRIDMSDVFLLQILPERLFRQKTFFRAQP